MTQREKRIWNAAKNRREIIEAGLSRRDLMKLGLLTSAGYLVAKGGLSARADGNPQSPFTRAFVEPLPIPPIKQPVPQPVPPAPPLNPAPQVSPNTAAGEGRPRPHQFFPNNLPGFKFYEIHQQENTTYSFHPDLPLQTIWGFDGGFPGPTYHAKYGEPILVRNRNELPAKNGGFGINQVSTHLHNGHTPSESDGFPCDFFDSGHFYDQVYPNILAGGDPLEAMSTLWYHDHRVDFTAQNVYKGLAGFYLLFNGQDTGNEATGFRLPSGDFDVPMIFADTRSSSFFRLQFEQH